MINDTSQNDSERQTWPGRDDQDSKRETQISGRGPVCVPESPDVRQSFSLRTERTAVTAFWVGPNLMFSFPGQKTNNVTPSERISAETRGSLGLFSNNRIAFHIYASPASYRQTHNTPTFFVSLYPSGKALTLKPYLWDVKKG